MAGGSTSPIRSKPSRLSSSVLQSGTERVFLAKDIALIDPLLVLLSVNSIVERKTCPSAMCFCKWEGSWETLRQILFQRGTSVKHFRETFCETFAECFVKRSVEHFIPPSCPEFQF